jgi:serine protease Do
MNTGAKIALLAARYDPTPCHLCRAIVRTLMNTCCCRRLVLAVVVAAGLNLAPTADAQTAPTAPEARSPVSLEAPAATAAVLQARAPRNAADLKLIQSQLQRVIQRCMPATVSVEVRGAAGSGVIVDKDGLVLTAAHVVGRAGRRGWVELPDGRRLRATSLGANHDVDAGMMKIDSPPPDLPFVPISQRGELAPGEWVVTIGQPGGIIEDRAPPVRFGRVLFRGDGILCTDCELVGGDSGGPLFDMRGQVVGIHSSIGPLVTHNFHVPVTSFRKSWDRLLAGEVWGGQHDQHDEDRPILGLSGRAENGRCLITQVFPGLPADKAGVKVGDIVTSIDGRQISTFDELARIVFFKKAGDKIELKIDRAGESVTVAAELIGAQ